MLIKQIIDFESQGPWRPGLTSTPTTDYFHDKTKMFKENLWVDYNLLLKYCLRQFTLITFPSIGQITFKIYLKSARF